MIKKHTQNEIERRRSKKSKEKKNTPSFQAITATSYPLLYGEETTTSTTVNILKRERESKKSG